MTGRSFLDSLANVVCVQGKYAIVEAAAVAEPAVFRNDRRVDFGFCCIGKGFGSNGGKGVVIR